MVRSARARRSDAKRCWIVVGDSPPAPETGNSNCRSCPSGKCEKLRGWPQRWLVDGKAGRMSGR